MIDLPRILQAVRYAAERDVPWCLATIFAVQGSTYRRPGARMAVAGDGRRFGAVSGGCLEGEVVELALRAIERETTSTTVLNDERDPGPQGFGTGCDGRIHLLLEPVAAGAGPLVDVMELAARRIPAVRALVVTARDGSVHTCTTVASEEGPSPADADVPEDLAEWLRQEAGHVLQRQRTQTAVVERAEGPSHVLFEFVEPRIRLIVVGDGYDAEPVVRLASELGWETIVVGRRSPDELRASFPLATHVRFAMHPEDVLQKCEVDAFTAVAIMSHAYERDRAALQQSVDSAAFYIGVLGPARRTARMAVRLDDRVHAPLGLDLGAETPAEIALTLASEVQATLRHRTGARLRDRPGPIHLPAQNGIVIEACERILAD